MVLLRHIYVFLCFVHYLDLHFIINHLVYLQVITALLLEMGWSPIALLMRHLGWKWKLEKEE